MTLQLALVSIALTVLLVLPFWRPEPSFVALAWVLTLASAASEGRRRV